MVYIAEHKTITELRNFKTRRLVDIYSNIDLKI